MKFKLTKEHIYDWPVVIAMPDPDNAGAVIEQTFTATFRAQPLDEAEALEAEIAKLPPADQRRRQDDVLRRILLGWDDQVVGDKGEPVPFSPEALELALLHSWFRIGVYGAYRQSLQGRAAAQGN